MFWQKTLNFKLQISIHVNISFALEIVEMKMNINFLKNRKYIEENSRGNSQVIMNHSFK